MGFLWEHSVSLKVQTRKALLKKKKNANHIFKRQLLHKPPPLEELNQAKHFSVLHLWHFNATIEIKMKVGSCC